MIRSRDYGQLLDVDWLREQYETLGKTCAQIAAEVGCKPHTVARRANQHGIKLRGRHGGIWEPKRCERCGDEYEPSGPAQRFCSAECRCGTKPCEQCGREFPLTPPQQVKQRVYQRRFCSFECQTAWRADNCSHRYVNSEGYVVVVKPPTESRGLNDQGYVRVNLGTGRHGGGRVLEHRHVMEQHLGRPLRPDETVHHINGDKQDNRIENLQLRQGKHGNGIKAVCLDCGSHNIGHGTL
jgi:hypothetical protein